MSGETRRGCLPLIEHAHHLSHSHFKVEIYSDKPLVAEIWQRGEHEPAPQKKLLMSLFLRRTILERFYYGSTTTRILKERKPHFVLLGLL